MRKSSLVRVLTVADASKVVITLEVKDMTGDSVLMYWYM